MKKPIYKRWYVWLLALVLLGGILSALDGDNEGITNTPEDSIEMVDADTKLDRKGELEKAIRKRIEEGGYNKVTIDKITINEDLGNEEEGYYIALVHLTFGVKNREETANEMMRMYSDDLVATLANQGIDDISQVAIFWKDEYNDRDLKYAYEYRDGGFYITDIVE